MNNELEVPYDVVIVGSGYSGTMVAVHLARAQRGLRVALIDHSKTFGRGVAYGTTDPKHLLNVPADQMGAFPDDIGHFYRWLKGASGESGRGRNPRIASRCIYSASGLRRLHPALWDMTHSP